MLVSLKVLWRAATFKPLQHPFDLVQASWTPCGGLGGWFHSRATDVATPIAGLIGIGYVALVVLLVTLLLCVSSGVAATILACVATICVEYCQYKVGKHIPDVCGQLLCMKSLWAELIWRNIEIHSHSLSFAEMEMTKLAGIISHVREGPVYPASFYSIQSMIIAGSS